MKKISKRLRKIYVKEILIVAAIVMSVWAIQPNFEIVINRSESLPIHAVIIKKGKLPTKVDQTFVFKVRNNPHYKMQEMTFIKLAGGFEGDEIKAIENREVFVGDNLIGTAKTQSLKGEPLQMITSGIIPAHKFFAYTSHKDSFDSRYQDLGLIDEKDIIGTAIATF